MNKREELAHALWKNRCERNGTRSQGWSRVVAVSKRALLSDADAILDELLEPGEASHAAFEAMDKPTCHGDPKARAWDVLQGYRAILTAIKAGA